MKEASGELFLLELFKLAAHLLKQDGFGGLDDEQKRIFRAKYTEIETAKAAHMNNVWHQWPI